MKRLRCAKKPRRSAPTCGTSGITPTGPVLVEGNNLPAYDGQIYHQQENPGTGLRPLVRSIIPEF